MVMMKGKHMKFVQYENGLYQVGFNNPYHLAKAEVLILNRLIHNVAVPVIDWTAKPGHNVIEGFSNVEIEGSIFPYALAVESYPEVMLEPKMVPFKEKGEVTFHKRDLPEVTIHHMKFIRCPLVESDAPPGAEIEYAKYAILRKALPFQGLLLFRERFYCRKNNSVFRIQKTLTGKYVLEAPISMY
jgi:hypothetical protein